MWHGRYAGGFVQHKKVVIFVQEGDAPVLRTGECELLSEGCDFLCRNFNEKDPGGKNLGGVQNATSSTDVPCFKKCFQRGAGQRGDCAAQMFEKMCEEKNISARALFCDFKSGGE